ncbi:hypothetical protein [Niallia taxi]|uniref:hypothetical protein n=1 Tax=Niallia taxi TaxID=2499688 RepID=UPI002E1C9EA1|nr:hypothetical protein [Niallia taxi]
MANIKELPALIVFDDPYLGKRNNPQAKINIARLLSEWRNRNGRIIFSQHMSVSRILPSL